jgi:hypothetical protein
VKLTRRIPNRFVRGTSLFVCLAFVLSFLIMAPLQREGISHAQGQGARTNDEAKRVAPPRVLTEIIAVTSAGIRLATRSA